MLSIRKSLAVAAASSILVAGLAGCSHNTAEAPKADDKAATSTDSAKQDDSKKDDSAKQDDSKKDDSAAPADDAEEGAPAVNTRPEECSNVEQDGPSADLGLFTVALHYFQPAVMVMAPGSTMKMNDYDNSQMHFELDTKATKYATNWGYSVDETPANLHVFYKLTDKDDKVLSQGMMMEMNAIDGSHYGLNLPKDTIKGPGDYKLTVTLTPPVNYGLHQDYVTGAPAQGWFKPLTAVMDWKVEQKNLDIIKERTVADPMKPSAACAKYPVKMFEDKAAQANMEKAEAVAPLSMDVTK